MLHRVFSLETLFWGLYFPQDAIIKLKTAEETSSRTVSDWQSYKQIKAGIMVSRDYKRSC